MQGMMYKYLLLFLSVAALFSCTKNADSDNGRYIVSARKMIGLTGINWSQAELLLRNKRGYRYTKSPDNLSNVIIAAVDVMAIDDSNRSVTGTILINVGPTNVINFISFATDTIPQAAAYAMMLNYNNESLQTLTGISSSIGEIVENGNGSNPPVSTVLSKLDSGQTVDQLAITYYLGLRTFTMVAFRQNDGRYVFGYRGMQ